MTIALSAKHWIVFLLITHICPQMPSSAAKHRDNDNMISLRRALDVLTSALENLESNFQEGKSMDFFLALSTQPASVAE